MNAWISNILRLVITFTLQILLIQNLHLLGLCYPCIYLIFLFALPPTLPRWAELLIAGIAGLIIDMFCDTLGIHTAACLTIGYLRPILIKRMIQDNDRLTSTFHIADVGIGTYIKIISILVVLHHSILFGLETFSFVNWWMTLLQIVISSAVTIVFVLFAELISR